METSIKKIMSFAEENNIELHKYGEGRFWAREGSAIVYMGVSVDRGTEYVDFFCDVVTGTRVDEHLTKKLLEVNFTLPFGSLSLRSNDVVLKHSIMGGEHMDCDEFVISLITIAQVAAEYADRIISKHGGKAGFTILKEIYDKKGTDKKDAW